MRSRNLLYLLLPAVVVIGAVVVFAQGGKKGSEPAVKSKTVSRILFADSSLTAISPTQDVTVTVEGSAVLDPQTGHYTYSYILTNEPSSKNNVSFLALAPIPWPVSVGSPTHWGYSRYVFAGADSAIVWEVEDVGTLPPGYVDTGNLPPSEFDLRPGTSVSGFSFVTPVPPIEDGTTFIAQGFDTLPGGAESWGDDYPYPSTFEHGVTGLTVGPGSAVGVPVEAKGDASSRLTPARPNPSGGVVSLGYTVSNEAAINLSVYDIAGRKIRGLVDAQRPAGSYSVSWNGLDDRGQQVAPGVYFYKLLVDGESAGQRRVVLYQRGVK